MIDPADTARGTNAHDDRELVARIRAGDRGAFEVLFRRHAGALADAVVGLVRSPEIAQEVVQDVFVSLWTRRATWVVRGDDVRAYLVGAARNRAIDYLRRLRRERLREHLMRRDATPVAVGEEAPLADARIQSAEVRAALEWAVGSLTPQYRRVLMLRAEHGLSYAQIAAVLDMPVRTVETQVRRAMEHLREALARKV